MSIVSYTFAVGKTDHRSKIVAVTSSAVMPPNSSPTGLSFSTARTSSGWKVTPFSRSTSSSSPPDGQEVAEEPDVGDDAIGDGDVGLQTAAVPVALASHVELGGAAIVPLPGVVFLPLQAVDLRQLPGTQRAGVKPPPDSASFR